MTKSSFSPQVVNMPKLILLLGMLQVSFMLTCHLLVYKIINLFGWNVSASTLLFPLTYFMGDIIAEVYGYKISRQIIWYSFIAMFIFDMLPALIIKIPSPSFWTHQASYDFIVGHLPRTFLGDFIAINAGQFLNVYILTKWKVVVRGKYFALRSLCATAIGEAVFTILAFSIMFVGTMPFSVWGQAMLFSYIFKAAFAFIAVYPALFLTRIIKKVENLDVYDTHTNFNPFSLTIK